MILLVSALNCEAQPLINHYQAKRSAGSTGKDLFTTDGKLFALSGIGKLKSAIATTAALEREQILGAINFGICGSSFHKPGEILMIHKVTDQASDRSFYPEILIKHGFPEASLITFDKPVRSSETSISRECVVDMEASGFCEACAGYLPTSRVAILKIVSDQLEGEKLSAEYVSSLVNDNLLKVSQFISLFSEYVNARRPDDNLINFVSRLTEKLKFTVYQRNQIEILARSKNARDGSLDEILPFFEHNISNKSERSRIYEELTRVLTA